MMILSQILLQTTNGNLLLGVMPESIGLLFFGIVLIISTIILREVFRRWEIEEEAKPGKGELEKLSKLKTERQKYPNGITEGDTERGVLRR